MSQNNRQRGRALTRRQPVIEDREGPAARAVVSAIVVLASVVVLTNLNDPYSIPKALLLGVGAIVLLGLGVWRTSSTGRISLPSGPAVLAALGVVVVMALAVVVNEHRVYSLFGVYGRSSGWLTYAAAFVVFVAILCSSTASTLRTLAYVIIAALVLVLLYAVAQALGGEPLGLHSELESVVSTLGQQNFVAGYLAVTLPFVVWALLKPDTPLPARAALGAVCLAALFVALKAQSFQVLPAVVAGLVVVLLTFAVQRVSGRRLVQAGGGLVVVLVLSAAVLHGPLDRQIRSGLGERVLLWQAARDMVIDDPATGYGPAGYATHFAEYRPRAHAVDFGAYQLADAPHSVPLEMFVDGGILLGLLYLGFVATVGIALVRGLRRLEGPDQLLLGAFGGGWVAYQVQSLVSIDFPTLLMAHFVLAAGVLVLTGAAPVRDRALALFAPVRSGRSTRMSSAGLVACVGTGVLALIGLWVLSIPLRADAAYRQAEDVEVQGPEAALAPTLRAVDLAPWNGLYWAKRAAILVKAGDQDGALTAGWRAAEANPSAPSYALSAGQLAHRLGKDQDAARYFRFAVAHDPNLADARTAYAGFLLDTGKTSAAVRQSRLAVSLRPDVGFHSAMLGVAYLRAANEVAATRAFEHALQVDSANETAAVGLAQLAQQHGDPDVKALWQRVFAINYQNAEARAALGMPPVQ